MNSTLIILDWDDTLFPTDWLERTYAMDSSDDSAINNIKCPDFIKKMYKLDRTLSGFIHCVEKYGKLVVITNASNEWIMETSKFLPRTQCILAKIPVISARDNYNHLPKHEWKRKAFAKEFKNNDVDRVISIGDGKYEYQALMDLYRSSKRSKKILKSIKLSINPTYNVLIDQLNIVVNAINAIHNADFDLDLQFSELQKPVTKKRRVQ